MTDNNSVAAQKELKDSFEVNDSNSDVQTSLTESEKNILIEDIKNFHTHLSNKKEGLLQFGAFKLKDIAKVPIFKLIS